MEPLRTDEPLQPGSVKREKDMDAAMLGGCAVFLTTAVLAFGAAVWPHLAYANAEKITTLRMCLMLGLIPSLVIGIVAARQGGLAGACGFVSGALITSVFFFLRLQQVFITAGAQTGPTPNYSAATMYLLPLGWFLLSVLVAALVMPRIRDSGLGAENNH
jgi:hypothetical protein